MRIKLIANPVAGGNARDKIARIVAWLRDRQCNVEAVLTETAGDAQRAAAATSREEFDRVVAAGGDGTLNEVINGLAPSDIPLAFIPLGTTNVFALETGISFDLEEACAQALHGTPRPIGLGRADGHRFLLMAGVGFDAEVVRTVNLRLKRWIGRPAYVLGGLLSLYRYRPRPLVVVTETGVRRRGFGVIVSNARLYGGRFVVSPGASLFSDVLHVCLLHRKTRLGMLRTMLRIAAGRPLAPAEASQLRARQVSVDGAGVPVQVDGDYLGELPRVFGVTFGEVTMILPGGQQEACHEM